MKKNYHSLIYKPSSWIQTLFWGFLLVAAWSLIYASQMKRAYQDSWLLADIWPPLALLLVFYVVYVGLSADLRRITLLTAILAFSIFALPAIKYQYIYGSAIDQAVHFDSIRAIAQTGQVEPNSVYQDTPSFHALVAMLSSLSGMPIGIWSKILPAILASMIPLTFYMLCKRAQAPGPLAKNVVILSGLSAPLLYLLNGTTFTAPLFVLLLVFFFLREIEWIQVRDKWFFVFMVMLYALTIIFWHPSTSFVYPLVFLAAGAIAVGLAGRQYILNNLNSIFWLGVLSITTVFAYWMYASDLVWGHFVRNIGLAMQPDLTGDLIPVKFFEISLRDRLVMGLFQHARDGLLFSLSILGIFFLALKNSAANQYTRLLRSSALIWLVWAGLFGFIFVMSYGAQGYKRFLIFVIACSPLLAGYGLWRLWQVVQKYDHWIPPGIIYSASILIIILLAFMQFYPYQPLVPKYEASENESDVTPILWMHRVNTQYQYHMLEFALKQLPTDSQFIVDYIGDRQAYLFFGSEVREQLRWNKFKEGGQAYILLHWPGKAGAYAEQAEYRSRAAIQKWTEPVNTSRIYDNGGSFILFYPEYPIETAQGKTQE